MAFCNSSLVSSSWYGREETNTRIQFSPLPRSCLLAGAATTAVPRFSRTFCSAEGHAVTQRLRYYKAEGRGIDADGVTGIFY
jgi:hypothetical protein